jgi:hypothetical protein
MKRRDLLAGSPWRALERRRKPQPKLPLRLSLETDRPVLVQDLRAPFIASMSPPDLSLGMVASPHCQLPFRPAQSLVAPPRPDPLNFLARPSKS